MADGIVRPARRPAGWTAPGPRPAGAGSRDDLQPRAGEDLCHLLGDWRVFQRIDGHRWSLDDLVTAWYAMDSVTTPPCRHLDLGCGIGSVLLMVAWCVPQVRSTGVEAQAISVELARRSIDYDGVAARCSVRHADLRDESAIPEGRVYDLVTATPPYFEASAGTLSDRPQRGPCRFELRGGLEHYAVAATRALAAGALFVACERARAHDRIRGACDDAGLELLHWRDVVPREGKPPRLTVFAAGWPGEHRVAGERATLAVRDRTGSRTPEFRALRARMGMPW